jgi:nucleoside-diphosphate-sugar epimerase
MAFPRTHEIVGSVRFPFYHFVNLNLSPTYEEMSSRTTSCQVDVRDVAKAHVLVLTAPNASNKRILLVSELVTPQLVVNTIRKRFPNLRERVAKGDPSQILPRGVKATGWNVSRSYEVFGEDWTYRTLEESLADTVEDLLRHENRWNT